MKAGGGKIRWVASIEICHFDVYLGCQAPHRATLAVAQVPCHYVTAVKATNAADGTALAQAAVLDDACGRKAAPPAYIQPMGTR